NRFWFGIRIQSFIPSGRSGSREPPLRTSTVSHFRCCRMFLLRSFIAGARIGEGRDRADRNGDIRRCSARRARGSSPARRPPAKLQWPVDFSLPIQRGKRGTAKSTTRKPWERHTEERTYRGVGHLTLIGAFASPQFFNNTREYNL